MRIKHIPRERDLHKKRVAAYCRVSTLLEEQEDSFETQVSYYTGYIEAHDDWEFAGIYSDEKSGTKAENRPGFQKLIADALNGKVDYILVKSISRFSRNIVDCQRYARQLHGNGVDVYFEKEHLDTADPSCSMMFSFLSAIAQDESRSISENVKWSYRERFKRGEYNLGNNRILGYDSVDGKLVPNKDARVVEIIYELYLEGKEPGAIAATLTQIGMTGRNGKPLTPSGILYILGNETYAGDKLLQKRAPKNFLTKQPDKHVFFESTLLKDDHEGIIPREAWDAVQAKLQARRADIEHGIKYHGGRTHFLYGKVFCGCCGSPMTRRTMANYDRSKYKAWICRDRHLGRHGNGCKMRIIREEQLLDSIKKELGCEITEENAVLLDRVYVLKVDLEIYPTQKASHSLEHR